MKTINELMKKSLINIGSSEFYYMFVDDWCIEKYFSKGFFGHKKYITLFSKSLPSIKINVRMRDY
jgi:hypothetical protein